MKFTTVWDVIPCGLKEMMNLVEEYASRMLVNFYQTVCCHGVSCSPMTV
jgi:hypothetical protein